jgi:exopolysaccharide biosynthesis polyprenyl glycosylphosphotransferase
LPEVLSGATTVLILTHWVPALAVLAAWLVVLAGVGSYGVPRPPSEFVTLGRSALLLVAAAEVVGWTRPWLRERLLVSLGIAVVVSVTVRLLLRLPFLPRRGRRLLVAGDPAAVERFLAELAPGPSSVRLACVGTPDAGIPAVLGVPWADLQELPRAVHRHEVDTVVMLPGRDVRSDVLRRLAWDLEDTGAEIFASADVVGVACTRPGVAGSGVTPLLRVAGPGCGGARLLKEAWERTTAALALLVAAPLLGICALVIRLESAGSPLFRQERVGRDGRRFVMLKLRTMSVDAETRLSQLRTLNETDGGILFKIRSDPRVTRVGRLLRRYSLDELPQLWNVIRGEMALIGPRPALPEEVEKYDEIARRRLAVKPGLTGLWQVSGRSTLSWDTGLRLDVHYVDNWSLAMDLRILARTAIAVISHTGAY